MLISGFSASTVFMKACYGISSTVAWVVGALVCLTVLTPARFFSGQVTSDTSTVISATALCHTAAFPSILEYTNVFGSEESAADPTKQ